MVWERTFEVELVHRTVIRISDEDIEPGDELNDDLVMEIAGDVNNFELIDWDVREI